MKNRKKLLVLVACAASVIMILMVMNITSYAKVLNAFGPVEFNAPCDISSTSDAAMYNDPPPDTVRIFGDVPKTVTPCQLTKMKEQPVKPRNGMCERVLNVMGKVTIDVKCSDM
ncbi:MAG TPA: hypothetical protein VMU29_02160 [Smithella sp.]|nr:hypothetical protein [Smithella sp.]